jgi:hypothetical protein
MRLKRQVNINVVVVPSPTGPRWPSVALRDGRPRDSSDQQPAGADVGADHRADLRDEERLAAVDLSPALDQALGLTEGRTTPVSV